MNQHLVVTQVPGPIITVIHIPIIKIREDWLCAELQEEMLHQTGSHRLVIDLSRVEYLCSAMLNVFDKIHTQQQSKGGELIFCSIVPDVYEIFAITKRHIRFKIVANLEIATGRTAETQQIPAVSPSENLGVYVGSKDIHYDEGPPVNF